MNHARVRDVFDPIHKNAAFAVRRGQGDGRPLETASIGRTAPYSSSGTARTGAKPREWRLPGPVNGFVIASDGRHLATANSNGTVYILRLAPPLGK